VAALLLAVLRSPRRLQPAGWRAVVIGAQAALAALLISNLTFPSLSSLSGTGMIGLLLAICVAAPAISRNHRAAETEGAGFEPAIRSHGLWFSRPVHSTALPPLQAQAHTRRRPL
jgi:hypothetical protein